MVNLGLVKDFKDCPPGIPRLSFRVPSGKTRHAALLRSWPERDVQEWELIIARFPEETPCEWVKRAAGILAGLKGYVWCVNTHDLIQVFQLPLDRALDEWNRFFWPVFKFDSLFYFKAEDDADLIRKVLLQWQKNQTTICFRNRYDLTTAQPPDVKEESQGVRDKSLVRKFKHPFRLLRSGKSQ